MQTSMPLARSVISDILSIRKWIFFLVLVVVSAAVSCYVNTNFATKEILINSYGEQISIDRIEVMMESSKKLWYISYMLIPVIILVRICYNFLFVAIGSFIGEKGLTIGQIFNACMKAELAFVLQMVMKLLSILFFFQVRTVADLNIIPFSLGQLLSGILPKWAVQPLSYINLFELMYMLLLAGFFTVFNGKSFKNNFLFALATYGVGLLLWIILVSYITLMFT